MISTCRPLAVVLGLLLVTVATGVLSSGGALGKGVAVSPVLSLDTARATGGATPRRQAPTTAPTMAPTTAPTTRPAGPGDVPPVSEPSWNPPIPALPRPSDGSGLRWTPAGRGVAGFPALYTATTTAPSGEIVGLAWLDTAALQVTPYAGTSQPGGAWTAQGAVPDDQRGAIVAAWNGGFQFGAANGGWYADGHEGVPLRDGAASLVVHADGSAGVVRWGRDATLTPGVVAVRQNLDLLVDAGSPAPSADAPGVWGAVLGGGARTWRSGLGDDGHGHLIYAAGPGLLPSDLASLLVTAGALRAMELDINPQWVVFASFDDVPAVAGQAAGTRLLAGMNFAPEHFFSPDWRDFMVAVARPFGPPPHHFRGD